jgi:hypothetical protein
MKQHGDGTWSGHREITREAVRRLFASRPEHGPGDPIRGLDERRYFEALDKAQAYQDRLVGAGVIRNYAGTSISVPYLGPGPTAHSAYANPRVQREHFLADPRRSGPENLSANAAYVLDRLAEARRAGGTTPTPREMTHLGAAAHALQDSYSGAHAWRDTSVYEGNAEATIQSLQVFTPGHLIGIDRRRNTHYDPFDKPPAESGSARAAVEATYRMLAAHEDGHSTAEAVAAATMRQVIEAMVRPDPAGVTVNLASDAADWRAERDRRMRLENGAPRRGSIAPESDIERDQR